MGESNLEETNAGITVRSLLKNVYSKFSERNHSQKIFLSDVCSLIANDSDYHRTKEGYMKYTEATVIELHKKRWAIARGERFGDYPADIFDSDLMALELETEDGEKDLEQITFDLSKRMTESTYWMNTIIFGMSDGRISFRMDDAKFSEKVLDLFKSNNNFKDYIVQRVEYDKEVILASTMSHPTKKPVLYKHEFSDFLTENIEKMLS